MGDIPSSTFFNFFVYLFIPFFLALILKKYRISPIIGYILGGVILTNFFGRLLSVDTINYFASFGIILLLFTFGLEIQFERIIMLKKFIVLGGFLQIIFSIIAITGISLFFNFSLAQAFLIGIALSSSSTSLIAKIIQDRGEEGSLHGELALGILMFQDLAFIPFLIIFSSLTTQNTSPLEVVWKVISAGFTSSIILGGVYYLGQRIIPVLFNKIARISRELLNLFIIIFIFFTAYISTLFGIPVLISIFIAGILVSQTLEHYHIFSQIRPLRDILAVIFFIFIGTHIKIPLIINMLPQILFFTFLVLFVKAIIIFIIFLSFRFNSRLSYTLSLFLFQIDEDAFILMSLGLLHGIFNQEQYLFVITMVLLSLILTPLLINSKDVHYSMIRSFFKKYMRFVDSFLTKRLDFDSSPIDVLNIKNHVVICGYGRVGAYVGRALLLANIPFIAIDYNFHTVEKAKKEGVNIIYGDPTDIEVLDYAECENASILISAVPERFAQERIVFNSKKLNPGIIILTRIHHKRDKQRMRDLGVEIIIQPEFEASLSIIRRILHWKGIDKEEVSRNIKRLKIEQGMV